MPESSLLPPLGLYVHIPWCVRKCPYCDFNSHKMPDQLNEAGYTSALLADLDFELFTQPGLADRTVATVFIGGGTPSLFSPHSISTLLGGIKDRLKCCDSLEVTLEANPGTVEFGRFAGYVDAGVNRLSIGVQSFNQEALQRIGRIHSADEALAAIESAKTAGFDRLNLDLMCGLPGQTLAMALADVQMAIDSVPDHISYYQLTLEPNTPFYQHPPPQLPDDDDAFDLQTQGRALLEKAGFAQYEVSAYARDGRFCRHNINYWQFGDYIGIGAGAHSKITASEPWLVTRRRRVRGPEMYLQMAGSVSAISGESNLGQEDLVMEFMLNALRLKKGFRSELFCARTGLPESLLWQRMQEAIGRGLLCESGGLITSTDLGWQFLDDAVAIFLK